MNIIWGFISYKYHTRQFLQYLHVKIPPKLSELEEEYDAQNVQCYDLLHSS